MSGVARKTVLPTLVITETCDEGDTGAVRVSGADEPYFVRPVSIEIDGRRRDGKPNWAPHQFNLFPLVLEGNGTPWPEANVFILSCLENTPNPDMRTFDAHALDLAAFRRFIEEENIDWTRFPPSKLSRPTYRYRSYLNYAMCAGEVSAKTINRRMGTVVAFYRWLASESLLVPEHSPWLERDVYFNLKDRHGFDTSKKVTTTDLSVRVPKQDDPYVGTIQDGGRLRPLPKNEQKWLVDALIAADNPEMTLIHLMGLLTGARLQTICTMKVRHSLMVFDEDQAGYVRLGIGHGTGIDSKSDKQMVLHIPIWLYRSLYIYANSERAKRRRLKAGSDDGNQYLFLTKQGTPYYTNKEDRQTFNPQNKRRYDFDGGAIGTFIRSVIKPYIQKTYGVKKFEFKFHDTRATFGMNLTDTELARVESGQTTLDQVREYVRTRMGHESAATTDLYLKFRHNLKFIRDVVESHEAHLKGLCSQAMEGLL